MIGSPPNGTPFDNNKSPSPSWVEWISQAYRILVSDTESGTTGNRPTKNLWVGRRYFDTTLGKPVFVKAVSPDVWVDGVGTVC